MSVRRHLVANYLGTGWVAVVGLAFIPLYIRYLGMESYGLIGFMATLQAWVSLLDLGLAPTMNREMARFSAGMEAPQAISDLLRCTELVYASTACLILLLLLAVSHPIALYWLNAQAIPPHEVSYAVALMGVVLSLQWMGVLYRSALLGLQHQVWLSVAGALAATVRAAGAVFVLACVSPTVIAFLTFQGAMFAIETVLLGFYLHGQLAHLPRPRPAVAAFRKVWRFAAGMAMVGLLATLLTQFDRLLLTRLLSLEQFGQFTLAVTVAGALAMVIVPLNNVAFPKLSEMAARGDGPGLAAQYHEFAQLMSIGVIPPALVLCLFSTEITQLWTGNGGIAAAVAPLLSVWVVGTALNGFMHVPYAAQLAHGWPKLAVVQNTITVMFALPAMLLLVPRGGALAAAWIWVAINVGYIIFGVGVMHTRILKREKWRWYMVDLLAPTIAGSVTALALLAWRHSKDALPRLSEILFLVSVLLLVTIVVLAAVPLGRRFLADAGRCALTARKSRATKRLGIGEGNETRR